MAWTGCVGIRKGPVCELGRKRAVTIWVAGGGTGPAARDQARWPVFTENGAAPVKVQDDVDGGTRLTVQVPTGARTLELRDPDAPGAAPRWSLALADARTHDEIDRLVAVGRGGKYDEALKELETFRAHAAPPERGPADAAIARMALALGKVEQAEAAFRAALAAARAEGRIADFVKDGSALLWLLLEKQQRYVEARALLEELEAFGGQFPEGQVWMDYDAGVLAANTGVVRTGLEKYRAAERGARRLDLKTLAEDATDEVARLLTRVGRADEAVALQKSLPVPVEPCAQATRALNLTWTLMERALHQTHGQRDPEVATALSAAKEAIRLCPESLRHRLAVVNSAEYALQIQDDVELERSVAEMQQLPPDRDVLRESRRGDVLGRWHLRRGQPLEALAAFSAQLPAVRSAGLLEEAFRAEVGVGRASLALGRKKAAVAALERAQHLLEQMLRGIPLAEGRGSFLGGHDDGVRYLVAALADSGAPAQALRAARWARSIELAHAARLDRLADLSPDERRLWDDALSQYQRMRTEIEHQAESDWSVPRGRLADVRAKRQARAEQARAALDAAYRLLIDRVGKLSEVKDQGSATGDLSQPSDGELFLAIFPSPLSGPSPGWFVFGATRAGVVIQRFTGEPSVTSAEGSARVLVALSPQLKTAKRVRLLPYGEADRVDWQAVMWNGRPLLASVEVEYGLDVGTVARANDGAGSAARTALVVSNPSGDLPASGPEADAVVRGLSGWQVTRLDGGAATRGATLSALPRVRLFHYAGHAEVSGPQSLASALLLKGDARVELGDLLAAPSLPDLVFLSACEAAGTTDRQPSLMGLAQAFVAAGSRAAIAPTRRIGDEDARAFVTAFYAQLAQPGSAEGGATTPVGGALDLGTVASVRTAFRKAALEVFAQRRNVPKTEHPGAAGWESFRLLVP
ncbi:MAG: CHAT domain-containing protein [Pseudomonadota bacterium]